jgi:hypothetical protein
VVSNLAEEGRLGEAREHVDELVALVREFGPHGALTRVGVFADQLRATEKIRAALDDGAGPPASYWREAIAKTLDGHLLGAADIFGKAGNRTLEAYARHFAGLRLLNEGRVTEARQELEKSLAFYRSVGATHYVRVAEDRLAGVQSESA